MPRNLALNISVGALLDSSVVKTFKAATDSSEKLGQQQKALNKEMRQLNAVRRYTDQLDKLRKEAKASGSVSDTLARKLRLTETRLSAASEDARRMGLNIRDLGQAEAKLNRQLARNNRALKVRQKLGTSIKRLNQGAGFVKQKAVTGSLIGGTAIGAGLTALTVTNRLSAEQANLAQAAGLSAKQMAIWTAIVSQVGGEASDVSDLVQELNNKFGESKGLGEQTTEVRDALHILRLDFERLKRLRPDEQFNAIIRQAQKIGGQEAISGADALLGGKASEFVGYINSLKTPFDELIARQETLYIGTQEGVQGAQAFTTAWRELSFTLGQAFREINGLIGKDLAPQMRQWSSELASWFRDSRNEVKKFSEQMGTTLVNLGDGLAQLALHLPEIVGAMSTLSGLVLKWFGGRPKPGKNTFTHETGAAESGDNPIYQEMRRQLKDFDRDQQAREMIESRQPAARNVSQDNRVTFNITQQPGQSPEQLAHQIEQRIRSVQNDRITNDAYDQPEAI
ncbi:hypothetical protein [Endozoicomonas sp. ALD040]|uniref:hypothetical protein n=1 Tax=Endozoicomonas sp. ALD040 TaxID=3403079 RepID=UPI003BAF5629